MILESKQDYIKCLQQLIEPLKPFYTPEKAGIKCGNSGVSYGEKTALMEGFARVLWGLAPLWGGGADIEDFSEIYLSGIRSGVNPESGEYWGKISDSNQRKVESAAFGLALILAPEMIWEPLHKEEKQRLFDWLNETNCIPAGGGNWQFFPIMVNLGLKNVGMPYNKEMMEQCFSAIESYYLGDGWYRDGNADKEDYYIPFAFHFYGLIYAKVMEREDPERSARFRQRAEKFAKDFIYWFDEDGSALAFGRSLTYRFAQVAFWSACVFAGAEPFPIGVMKGIISRNIAWWMEQPIFDHAGVLTVGYAYPNQHMSEQYNAFGSPYWALKAFLILALPEEHPLFSEPALPLPGLDAVHSIPKAHMVMQRIGGYTVALNGGQEAGAGWRPMHAAEKYAKFAYSSRYAFSVPRSYYGLEETAGDNMLVFVKDEMSFVRKHTEASGIDRDGALTMTWSPYRGVTVETKITPTEYGHIRQHRVTCKEPATAYDFGFATADGSDKVMGNGESITLERVAPNTNLIAQNTVLHGIRYDFPAGETTAETKIYYPNCEK